MGDQALVPTRASVRRVQKNGLPGWEGVLRQGRRIVWASGKDWHTQSIARSDAHRRLLSLSGVRLDEDGFTAPPMPELPDA